MHIYMYVCNERVGLRHFDGEPSSKNSFVKPEGDGNIILWWMAWR